MRRNYGLLAAAFALGSLGVTGISSSQSMQSLSQTVRHQVNEMKSTPVGQRTTSNTIHNNIGGIPLVTILPDFGMSPKEYGLRFGHGNGKGKLNKQRLSHNAKLKRRG